MPEGKNVFMMGGWWSEKETRLNGMPKKRYNNKAWGRMFVNPSGGGDTTVPPNRLGDKEQLGPKTPDKGLAH